MAKRTQEAANLLEQIRDLKYQAAVAGNYGIRGGQINGMSAMGMREILLKQLRELERQYIRAGGDPENIE